MLNAIPCESIFLLLLPLQGQSIKNSQFPIWYFSISYSQYSTTASLVSPTFSRVEFSVILACDIGWKQFSVFHEFPQVAHGSCVVKDAKK